METPLAGEDYDDVASPLSPPFKVVTLYNPHLLHLLYTKARHLHHLLSYYYTPGEKSWSLTSSSSSSSKHLEYFKMMEQAVLGQHGVPLLALEISEMSKRVHTETSSIPLLYCNFEYFLHRFTRLYRPTGTSIGNTSLGTPFPHETACHVCVKEEMHPALQWLVRTYIEEFYLTCDEKKIKMRLDQLFILKYQFENEEEPDGKKRSKKSITDMGSDYIIITYDKALTGALLSVYFIDEFINLLEYRKRRLNTEDVIADFVFHERPEEDTQQHHQQQQQSSSLLTPIPLLTAEKNNELEQLSMLLPKMRHECARNYRVRLTTNRHFFSTHLNPTNNSSSGGTILPEKEPVETGVLASLRVALFGGGGGSSNDDDSVRPDDDPAVMASRHYPKENKTMDSVDKEELQELQSLLQDQASMNQVYTQKGIGLVNEYYTTHMNRTTHNNSTKVIVKYDYLSYEAYHVAYSQVVYHLLFYGELVHAHRQCVNNLSQLQGTMTGDNRRGGSQRSKKNVYCALCWYFQPQEDDSVTKVKTLYSISNLYPINDYQLNSQEAEQEKVILERKLTELRIVESPQASSPFYKILFSLSTLYGRLLSTYYSSSISEVKQGQKHGPLFAMISPVSLLECIRGSGITSFSELEPQISGVIDHCRDKVNMPVHMEPSAQEIDLALDLTLLEICIGAVQKQQLQVERYERAQNTCITTLNSTPMHTEIDHNLKMIYAMYLDILCQLLRRRATKLL